MAYDKPLHWNANVAILMKFPSLVTPEVVILTNLRAASENAVFLFQCTWTNDDTVYWRMYNITRYHVALTWYMILTSMSGTCPISPINLPFGQLNTVTELQWRHNECDGVSNHRCLLFAQPFVQAQIKETSKRHRPLWWESTGPVDSHHKRPVTRKMFLFDDIIMDKANRSMTDDVLGTETPINMHKQFWDKIRKNKIRKDIDMRYDIIDTIWDYYSGLRHNNGGRNITWNRLWYIRQFQIWLKL